MVQLSMPPAPGRKNPGPWQNGTNGDTRRRDDSSVRSLFISDVHLGSRYSKATELLAFLEGKRPQYLYLVGDFLDGWELRRRWHWEPTYDKLFQKLIELSKTGTVIRYTPGNHDSFLRNFLQHLGVVDIQDEFVYEAANKKRFMVMHGDQFDKVELCAQWLSVIGSIGYDLLLSVNSKINRLRTSLGLETAQFSGNIKKKFKQAVRYISRFEDTLAEYARSHSCHGIICGHIHTPTISNLNGILYCNSGDWVENCTALVELNDGSMNIVYWQPAVASTVEATYAVADVPLAFCS